MYGQSVNRLNIRLQDLSKRDSEIVWSRQTSQGNTWRYAQIFTNELGNFKYIIEGIVRFFHLIISIIITLNENF